MAQDAELAVRRALSHSLRSAAQLPHDVALRLASDVEAVALPILINSPVLTDQDLIALVNGGSEPQAGGDRRPPAVSELSMPIEISPKVPTENSPLRYASIASKATRRLDVGEDIKIELDDGLESLGGGAVAKAVGQGVAPGGVFGLQGEQFGDGVVPSLRSGASIGRSAIADQRMTSARLAGGRDIGPVVRHR